MSAALPSELQARFRDCIEEGLSARAAAARLKLPAATGVRWQRKLRRTGAIAPEVPWHPFGRSRFSAHRAFLEELVSQDGDITLPELAGALKAATEVGAHSASIGCFLRKLGYKYKKSLVAAERLRARLHHLRQDCSDSASPRCRQILIGLCSLTKRRVKSI